MYKLLNSGVRLGDATIPADPDNRDWQEYQEWLAEGNTPLPADPGPDPATISAKSRLVDIDRKSIRAIREWISARQDAPAELKALETLAETERAKIV